MLQLVVGNGFYESQSVLDFDEETQYKINCFDWEDEFKSVFKAGGFDVVIGNPPWGALFDESNKGYIKNNYKHSDIEIESYILFIEKGIRNLSNNGYLGLIIPSNLFTNIRYFSIRKFILENCKINTLIDLGSGIFKSVAADSGIIISNKNIDSNNVINAFVGNIQGLENINYNIYKQSDFINNNNYIFNIYIRDIDKKLAEKIKNGKVELKNFVSFARGIEFGYSSKYVTNNKENDLYKPVVAVRCMQRYSIHFEDKFIEFNEKDKSNFKSKDIYEKEKILLRRIGNKLIASIDFDKYYNLCDIYNLLLKDGINLDLKYLLSIINSKLMSYYLDIEFKSAKKLFPKIPIANLEKLPIKNLNLDDKQDKEMHDKMVALVDSIITLNKKLSSEKNPNAVTMISRQINAVDKQIDSLVYKLYNLSNEEIKIIEGDK
ncbi:TaqI-like C-terminal specificity domain-containing protein [Brachyspira murdochii]